MHGGAGVTASVLSSLVLHAGLVAAFLAMRPGKGPPAPPYYRVNLIAAAASEAPAAGVVTPPKATPPPTVTKAPPRPKTDEVAPVPTKTLTQPVVDKRATPSVAEKRVDPRTPVPVAGGGTEGGTGADVANVKTDGIDFPYPGYLEQIVRAIRLRFRPPAGMAALTAEVSFLIKRDGSIMGFRFTKNSRNFNFDLEVQGAIEAAANDKAFGALPRDFKDDVLPVVFSFDPRLIRP
jgi:protein TonB